LKRRRASRRMATPQSSAITDLPPRNASLVAILRDALADVEDDICKRSSG
jgi:hypothetical protein